MAKLNGRRIFTACIEHIAVGSLSFIEQVKIDLPPGVSAGKSLRARLAIN
jgi:hypothetical protein